MIKYKRIDAANGRIMYYKNGKMTSKEDIPVSILNNLEAGAEISVGTPDPETLNQTVDGDTVNQAESNQNERVCIFCGEPATRTKYINLQTIQLCQEDKVNHTTGEIFAQYKKALSENVEEKPGE